MKRGLVTKLDKKNKATSKKLTMMPCQQIIAIFPIYNQFGAICSPDSGRIVCKTYICTNNNFLSYKNWKENWSIPKTTLTLLLWVKVPFWQKHANFCKKIVDISKIMKALVLKGIFSETKYACVLTYQF